VRSDKGVKQTTLVVVQRHRARSAYPAGRCSWEPRGMEVPARPPDEAIQLTMLKAAWLRARTRRFMPAPYRVSPGVRRTWRRDDC
jgi:hypothetical protein